MLCCDVSYISMMQPRLADPVELGKSKAMRRLSKCWAACRNSLTKSAISGHLAEVVCGAVVEMKRASQDHGVASKVAVKHGCMDLRLHQMMDDGVP